MIKNKNKYSRKKIYRKSKNRVFFNKMFIILGMLVSIVTLIEINNYIEDMYKGKDVGDNTIEFYMEMADEIGDKKVQLSWKELLAIDMVRNNEDLSNIKKKDVSDIGSKFIIEEKNDEGESEYKVKEFDDVLSELKFNDEEKRMADKYLEDMKYNSLSKLNIEDDKDKVEYIDSISVVAKENYEEYGILPSITVSQAILESGWGQSYLTKESNNVFGIKADSRWEGEKIEVSTKENYDDKTRAYFRVYSSIEESIRDHGRFLSENQRYEEHGLFEATHYTTQAKALQNAGYSTKQNEEGELIYSEMLIQVIRSYNLQLLDREVQTQK